MDDLNEKELNKFVRKLLESYAAKNTVFDIKKKVEPLPGNRLRLNVKILPQTRVTDIKKNANDVRLSLKLAALDVVEGQNKVYIVVSKEQQVDEHHLFNIANTPEFAEARKTMALPLLVGIDDFCNPVIVDLMDPRCPHILISGTTGSGKSIAIKSFLITMSAHHSPEKINLLIGDKANDLSQFTDLPHLSHPIIDDFDTLLKTLLLLKDEMARRITLKNTDDFNKFPVIVCVIDEFNSLMAEAADKRSRDLAVDTITQILRMGRHARIHFILAAHNPTKKNMLIDTSDLPVKMAFQVSNPHNSVTALGEGGAEKLRGQGDMLFKMNGKIQHLKGAYILPEQIDYIVRVLRQRFNSETMVSPNQSQSLYRHSPRGVYGFTITDSALQYLEDKIQGNKIPLLGSSATLQESKSCNDQLFAEIIVWALNQDEISCNQILEKFHVGWRRANTFIDRLQNLGIIGKLDAKLPRKVILHSTEELPQNIIDFLREN